MSVLQLESSSSASFQSILVPSSVSDDAAGDNVESHTLICTTAATLSSTTMSVTSGGLRKFHYGKSMLLIPDDILVLNLFGKGLQKDLIYHIPKDQCEGWQG